MDKKGREFLAEYNVAVIKDKSGSPAGFVATMKDVSERKKAEDELRKFKTISDKAGYGVIVGDLEGNINYVNTSFASMHGYTPDELVGKHLSIFHTEQQMANLNRLIEQLNQEGSSVSEEIWHKRNDNTEFPTLMNGTLVKDENGVPLFMAGTAVDITERKQAEAALQKSEAQLSTAMEIAKLGYWEFDPAERVFIFNDHFYSIFHTSAEQVGGYKMSPARYAELFIHPDDRHLLVGDEIEESLETATPQFSNQLDHRIIYADGGVGYISVRAFAVTDSEGRIVRIYGANQDITERKQAEEALRKSKEFSYGLIAAMQDGLSILTPEGVHIDVNQALCEMTGFSKEELIGVGPPHPYWAPEAYEEIDRAFQKTLRGEFTSFELTFMRKNDERFQVIVSPSWVKDEPGNVVSYFATVKDITERKRAEELFRALADSSPIGIYIVQDGRFQYVNPQMQKQIGYSSHELLGRESLGVVFPEDRDKVRESAVRMLKGEQSQPYEYRSIDKKGNIKWVLETVASIMYQGKRATVGNQMDITERKRLEEEQQKVEKLESIGTLAGGIAHDFNNILTVIMGNISMAIREVGPGSRAAGRLEEAEKASLRARDLTHRLLTFARGGAPIKKTISIAELVREATNFGLRGSNVSPNYALPDDLWAVEADEGQISQVITNLVINAVEAMPMGGTLDISAKNYAVKKTDILSLPEGSYVEVTVADHGIGMSKAHLERLFEPYFTTKQRGSGLGLATSYSIIKNHGGHITVESELGVGTTLHIYLPTSGKPASAKIEIPKELPITGKGRILVMDDEATIRLLLSRMLSRAGYEVELAENGEETIQKYAEAREAGKSFAAVIMDLTIPGGMGGREAINKLREIDQEVKAIVSSGYSTDPIMADYRQYGFSGVVAKPYQAGEVEKTLRNILLGTGG